MSRLTMLVGMTICAGALLAAMFSADAAAVVRKVRDALPPMVAPNGNTPGEEAPLPPQQPPTTDVVEWRYDEIWRKGDNSKLMVVADVPRGTIFSFYDSISRRHSKIEERTHAGAWRTIWDGPEETIGMIVAGEVQAAARWDGGVVFAAEAGSTFLRYDTESGAMSRLAKVPSGYKWNIFTAPWKAKNTVAVGGYGPDVQSRVFDAYTGRELFKTPLSGLIAGMAEDADGMMWCAMSDGTRGVCTSDGRSWRDFSAASIAHPWGTPTAGSMDDGWLWQYRSGKWIKWINMDASKINRMVFDERRDVLLVAASRPDTFAAIHADGTVEQIARFEDEAKTKSGEQFDATIEPGHGDTVVFGRSAGKSTFAYRGTPK